MIQKKYNDIPAALADGEALPFVYLRTLGSVSVGLRTDAVLPKDMDEVEQLRFFGPAAEVRIVRTDAGQEAWRIEDGDSRFLDETVGLLPGFGKKLVKRKLLQYDEDGQGSICAVRLVNWEG